MFACACVMLSYIGISYRKEITHYVKYICMNDRKTNSFEVFINYVVPESFLLCHSDSFILPFKAFFFSDRNA